MSSGIFPYRIPVLFDAMFILREIVEVTASIHLRKNKTGHVHILLEVRENLLLQTTTKHCACKVEFNVNQNSKFPNTLRQDLDSVTALQSQI